ncbi:sigma-54 dependent transcriptional regulator, partial [bacterium]|nr:sigma-54 dependent transcriptional regulator [bacterium]
MAHSYILILEDEKKLRQVISLNLRREGFEVLEAETGNQALDILNDRNIDYLLCDLRLPGEMDGLEVLEKTRALYPNIPVIIMTAFGGIDEAVKAMKLGAHDYLPKPFEINELILKLRKAKEQIELIKENIRLKELVKEKHSFDNIIGKSEIMQDVFNKIRLIAPHDTTVLITGSSGTGKELVAKAIHFNSQRSNKGFYAINCAALPKELMESELFGHVKGAFTGATKSHNGLFLEASGGSLFLDEIGELPLDVQAKFLRVIEEKKVRQVGGTESFDVDVRFIAATSKNLSDEVEGKNFREDLFYRLNVVQIRLPDLSERIEDIPLLVDYFVGFFNKKLKRTVRLSQETNNQLMRKRWKGNVRELANFIERLILLSHDDLIESVDFFSPSETSMEPIKLDIPDRFISLKEVKKE